MKQLLSRRLSGKKLALFFPLVLAALLSIAQPPTVKPYMWLSSTEGKNRAIHFNDIKLGDIINNTKRVQTNRFPLYGFFKMLDHVFAYYTNFEYLKVYIGIYTQTKSVPVDSTEKLVLIFVPASKQKELEYYFLENPFDQATSKIEKYEKDEWSNEWVSIMSKSLGTIDPKDPWNLFPPSGSGQVLSDTRFVTFCREDLEEMRKTKKYYSAANNLSDNAVAYLDAYPPKGIPLNQVDRYKNRIALHFELLDNKNKEFDLDTIPDFAGLDQNTVSLCPIPLLDNGLLCPTHCPVMK